MIKAFCVMSIIMLTLTACDVEKVISRKDILSLNTSSDPSTGQDGPPLPPLEDEELVEGPTIITDDNLFDIITSPTLPALLEATRIYEQEDLDNGWGSWQVDNGRVYNARECLNNKMTMVRECLANDFGKCEGPQSKEALCEEEMRPTFSAWTHEKTLSCVDGKDTYSRTCISLTGRNAECFGPDTIQVACDQPLSHISTYSKRGECLAAETDLYRTLCDGQILRYNGLQSNSRGCFLNESGTEDCSQAETTTVGCFLPHTICTGYSYTNIEFVEGSSYDNFGQGICGVDAVALAEAEDVGFREWDRRGINICRSLGKVQEVRECTPEKDELTCFYTVEDMLGLAEPDMSCIGETKQYAACTPLAQYDFVESIDGGWSDWETITGCHENTELSRNVIVQKRYCNNPEPLRRGAACEGASLRTLDCGDKGEKLTVAMLVDQSLLNLDTEYQNPETNTLSNYLDAYREIIQNMGAQLNTDNIDTASMDMNTFRDLIFSLKVNGNDPNVIVLVGSFPYARIFLEENFRFSVEDEFNFSDFPFMTASKDIYSFSPNNGITRDHFVLNPLYIGQNASISRILARIDFTNANFEEDSLLDFGEQVLNRYKTFFEKVINTHANSRFLYSENKKIPAVELLDDHWSNFELIGQSNLDVDIYGKYQPDNTNALNFVKIFNRKASTGAFAIHGSGHYLAFWGKSYVPPSNDPRGLNSLELYSEASFRSLSINAFNCYSLSPIHENNVGNSILLGKESDVIALIGSYATGAMNLWRAFQFYDTFLRGETLAEAYLRFAKRMTYGSLQVNTRHSRGSMGFNSYRWSNVIGIAGDPFVSGDQFLNTP